VNIFATSDDPEACAKFLDNKRVVKMILESAQLLSTAQWRNGRDGWYALTHANHPCAMWTSATRDNYLWVYEHLKALLNEYTVRYTKVHKCNEIVPTAAVGRLNIPTGALLEFENCTNFKHLPVHEAYVHQLLVKWNQDKRAPIWHAERLV
jgi:hypothetical protein